MENKISVDAVEQMSSVHVYVEIRRLKEARLRIWFAKYLIRLGVWIGNLGLEENEQTGVLITEKPEEIIHRTGVIRSVVERPLLIIQDDDAP